MTLPETKVTVEVLKAGRWAQEVWLPQLVVAKGDRVVISIAIAYRLQAKGKCTILAEKVVKKVKKIPKKIIYKSEKNPTISDKRDAEG